MGLGLLLLSISAAVAAPARATPIRCHFVVRFGSRGIGPDTRQMTQLRNYLRGNDALVESRERLSGKAGERAFCIHAKSHGDLGAVKGHLEGIVGRSEGKKNVPPGAVISCVSSGDAKPRVCSEKFPLFLQE